MDKDGFKPLQEKLRRHFSYIYMIVGTKYNYTSINQVDLINPVNQGLWQASLKKW